MERKGYTCDGGCGATLVIGRYEGLPRHGWFVLFGPGAVAPEPPPRPNSGTPLRTG